MGQTLKFLLFVTLFLSAAFGQTCPPSGIVCYPSDCSAQFQLCSGTTFWPPQSTAPGTVCYQGTQIAVGSPQCAGTTITTGSTATTGSTTTTTTGSPTPTPTPRPTSAPTSPPGSWPNGPLKAMYIIDGGSASDIQAMVNAGYNLILLAFHVSGTPKYAASVWAGLGGTTQQSVVSYAHSHNARIVVSAEGSEDAPYWKSTGAQYGTTIANWAAANHLDGVDFDLENIGGGFTYNGNGVSLNTAQMVQWIADATNAARSILGTNAVITHAPQSPYFGANHGWANGYPQVYQAAPSINFLLVQYYNNDNPPGLTTYSQIFVSDNGGAVQEIVGEGVPLSKIVVGKPVTSSDAGSGYVSASSLHSIFTQAQTNLGWNAGVMGWVWHDSTTNGNWISTIYP